MIVCVWMSDIVWYDYIYIYILYESEYVRGE